MNAAERLFLDKGIEATTIDDIARGADVAKGTFYLHFPNKSGLVEALRDRFVRRILDGIEADVAGMNQGDWRGRLTAWSKACCEGYFDAARLHHLVFVAAPPPTRDGLADNILIEDLAALLERGMRAKAWNLKDPPFTATFLFNALHGLVQQPHADAQSRGRLMDAIAEHFLRIVGRP